MVQLNATADQLAKALKDGGHKELVDGVDIIVRKHSSAPGCGCAVWANIWLHDPACEKIALGIAP